MKSVLVRSFVCIWLGIATTVGAGVCEYGYTDGIRDLRRVPDGFEWTDLVAAQRAAGVDVTTTMISFGADYTLLRDALPEILDQFPDDVRVVLDMTQLLFTPRSGGYYDCSFYDGGIVRSQWTVYRDLDPGGNWHTRLADVDAVVGDVIRSRIDIIAVHVEANNTCVPWGELGWAVSALRDRFPGTSLAAGYALRTDHPDTNGLPAIFPDVDIIGVWGYGVHDPSLASDPLNVDTTYYPWGFFDPDDPLVPGTAWGDLVSHLHDPGSEIVKSVMPILESFFTTRQIDRGWTVDNLAEANRNWHHWANNTKFTQIDGETPLVVEPPLGFLWSNVRVLEEDPYLGAEGVEGLRQAHQSFFFPYTDVAPDHWARASVQAIYCAGIAQECNQDPSTYCPSEAMTRAKIARFLLRAVEGGSYWPPDQTGDVFDDVPLGHEDGDWIEELWRQGYTGGCGVENYCPERPLSRAEIAVFLLRAHHGPGYMPPPVDPNNPIFDDVPPHKWYAPWVEQLYREGFTQGCAQDPLRYCPTDATSRLQAAVFLARLIGG